MTLIVPNTQEVIILTDFLTLAHTLRLYSNDVTPDGESVIADFTQVAGGGYAGLPLVLANWTITAGAPTVAVYTVQQFTFTDTTTAPSTIYGYYITRDADSSLMWAERFPTGSVPFEPINGSIIRITPRITCESA